MSVERSRLELLAGGAVLLLGLGRRFRADAAPLPGITVYKDPT
jgi:hypothetical protein